MARTKALAEWNGEDRVLGWTMRIVGFALAVMSLVFLTQDIVQGSNATYFFSISAGLGIITLITSWMPGGREQGFHRSTAAQYASSVGQ